MLILFFLILSPLGFTSTKLDSLFLVLENHQSDIQNCSLDDESKEVSDVVAGYVARKMEKRTPCSSCKMLLVSSCETNNGTYLSKLSRGGLVIPSNALSYYVAKCFAVMEIIDHTLRTSDFDERVLTEHALGCTTVHLARDFLCSEHVTNIKYIHRTIINTFYNNDQKIVTGSVRKDAVKSFKTRQRLKET